MTDRTDPTPAYSRLFSAQLPYWPPPYANRSFRLSTRPLPGANVNVVKSSERDLVEATITHATGTRQ